MSGMSNGSVAENASSRELSSERRRMYSTWLFIHLRARVLGGFGRQRFKGQGSFKFD